MTYFVTLSTSQTTEGTDVVDESGEARPYRPADTYFLRRYVVHFFAHHSPGDADLRINHHQNISSYGYRKGQAKDSQRVELLFGGGTLTDLIRFGWETAI